MYVLPLPPKTDFSPPTPLTAKQNLNPSTDLSPGPPESYPQEMSPPPPKTLVTRPQLTQVSLHRHGATRGETPRPKGLKAGNWKGHTIRTGARGRYRGQPGQGGATHPSQAAFQGEAVDRRGNLSGDGEGGKDPEHGCGAQVRASRRWSQDRSRAVGPQWPICVRGGCVCGQTGRGLRDQRDSRRGATPFS